MGDPRKADPPAAAEPGRPGGESYPIAERPPLARARRVVVKLGTRVITHDDGRLALARLFEVVEVAARERRAGREVAIVSSGAVGLGRDALGLAETPRTLEDRQACAAVGQSRLMALYEQGFSRLGVVCAQVLLTRADLDDRARYLDLRGAFLALLRRGVVPVINENDAVSTEELASVEPGDGPPVFGDNDRLSALVATKLDADLLVLLTDVPGLCARDPREDPSAEVIARIHDDAEIPPLKPGAGSSASRGGMRTKVEAARIAVRSGCHAVIAPGRAPGTLERVLRGDEVGTWFVARAPIGARRSWIAYATAPRGALWLDAGAVEALLARGASLLARGVTRVDGRFERGDVVLLRGPGGEVLGRGIVHCDAEAARRWTAGDLPAGVKPRHALVHRDHMTLEPAAGAGPGAPGKAFAPEGTHGT